MAGFNGSGTFQRNYNWVTDDGNGINIVASRMDTEDDGFATGLSSCITKDGQTTITTNIPFNSKKITGLANGSARTDSIALGQVQDNSFGTLGTLGGSADTYTASPSPSITAYATGMEFNLKVNADNTGASTLNVSAIAAKDIKKYDGAGSKIDLEAGDLQQDQYYKIIYDGTDFVVLNPEKPYINLTNNQATTTALGATLLPKPITITNNSTDADHDIDFGAGVMNFNDGSGQAATSALTKQLDSAWAAGDDAGGLFTGSIAADTWYHCFAIYNPTTQTYDAGFDTSITAANAPSGYTKYEYRVAILTDSSSNILAFTQKFNQFWFDSKILNTSTLPSGLTNETISTPLGREVEAIMFVDVFEGSGTSNILIKSNVVGDEIFLQKMGQSNVNNTQKEFRIWADTNSQIQHGYTAGAPTTFTGLYTRGYIDHSIKF